MSNKWLGLRFFKIHENWGNHELIKSRLLKKLDSFREKVGSRVVITRGTQGKNDSGKSQHPLGRAVDVILPKTNKHPEELIEIAEECGFTGIGYYRDWRYFNKRTGGLHLDIREIKRDEPIIAKWLCVNDIDGIQVYYPFSNELLEKFLKELEDEQ